MIDLAFKTVQAIINKENNGYVSPTEFNTFANLIQYQIFRNYFEDENRDKNRKNKGLTNKGYGNLDFNQRQMITQFADEADLGKNIGVGGFVLPENLYFIEDDGVLSDKMRVIEEVEKSKVGYFVNSSANDATYPTYTRTGNVLRVSPASITNIKVNYLRKPKMPMWTFEMVGGKELYDPSSPSFQDFELHESEFPNIVLGILEYFSINLREAEIVKIADSIKSKIMTKDEN